MKINTIILSFCLSIISLTSYGAEDCFILEKQKKRTQTSEVHNIQDTKKTRYNFPRFSMSDLPADVLTKIIDFIDEKNYLKTTCCEFCRIIQGSGVYLNFQEEHKYLEFQNHMNCYLYPPQEDRIAKNNLLSHIVKVNLSCASQNDLFFSEQNIKYLSKALPKLKKLSILDSNSSNTPEILSIIPQYLTSLQSLEYTRSNENNRRQMNYSLEKFTSLENLTKLYIWIPDLSVSIHEENFYQWNPINSIGKITNLQKLYLAFNIPDKALLPLIYLTKLNKLRIEFNDEFDGSIFKELTTLSNLTYIDIDECTNFKMSKGLRASIKRYHSLTSFSIDGVGYY